MVEYSRFAVGILTVSVIVSEIQTFPVSSTVSGCRSLLQSPRNKEVVLAVIENPRFAVGIWMMSIILSEIQVLPVAILPFPVADRRRKHFGRLSLCSLWSIFLGLRR